jgi:hypothetical protein
MEERPKLRVLRVLPEIGVAPASPSQGFGARSAESPETGPTRWAQNLGTPGLYDLAFSEDQFYVGRRAEFLRGVLLDFGVGGFTGSVLYAI